MRGSRKSFMGCADEETVGRFRLSGVCYGPVVFSPDGKQLAVSAGKQIELWEIEDGDAPKSRSDVHQIKTQRRAPAIQIGD